MKITERKTNTQILKEMKVGETIVVNFEDFASWRSQACRLKVNNQGSWTTEKHVGPGGLVCGKLTRES